MRFLCKTKDGGPESPVDAYVLLEIKGLMSIMLLKFNKGGRKAFHTHAFNALTWFLSGNIVEEDISGEEYQYRRSIVPKLTKRDKNHRVFAHEDSWCFTVRGPWKPFWTETLNGHQTVLTHGRKIV